jgi:hypothetical protein
MLLVAPVAYDGEAGAEVILLAGAIHGANTEMVNLSGAARKRGSDFANRREPVMNTGDRGSRRDG